MTKILKDRGFVLKKKKYRETSKLITIFSENSGKLNLIARGVRTPKNKISAVLEPFNFIEFVYYDKPTRDLQYISSADFIDTFSSIKSNYDKLKIAFVIIELVNIFSHEGERNDEFFNLVYNSLKNLNENINNYYLTLIGFLLRLCEISGYPVYNEICPLCLTSINLREYKFYFTRNYGVVCSNCKSSVNSIINLGEDTKRIFAQVLLTNLFENLEKNFDGDKLKYLYLPILEFLQYHVEEVKQLKSIELF